MRRGLLNVHEVAELLRVHPETVRVLARRKDLQAVKVGRGPRAAYRFTPRAVATYLGVSVDDLPDVAA